MFQMESALSVAAAVAESAAEGVAVDGGKDSLSMAAKTPDGATVKAPGTLVISLYAPCPNVRNVRTPDLKRPGASTLVLVRPVPAGIAQPLPATANQPALPHPTLPLQTEQVVAFLRPDR